MSQTFNETLSGFEYHQHEAAHWGLGQSTIEWTTRPLSVTSSDHVNDENEREHSRVVPHIQSATQSPFQSLPMFPGTESTSLIAPKSQATNIYKAQALQYYGAMDGADQVYSPGHAQRYLQLHEPVVALQDQAAPSPPHEYRSVPPQHWYPVQHAPTQAFVEHVDNNESNDVLDSCYAQLLFTGFKASRDNTMTLTEAYQWVSQHSEKAKDPSNKGWKNSVRHNLSMNAAFEQVKTPGSSKKSSRWRLTAQALRDGILPTTRYRKAAKQKPNRSAAPSVNRQKSGARGGQATRRATAAARRQAQSAGSIRRTPYPHQDPATMLRPEDVLPLGVLATGSGRPVAWQPSTPSAYTLPHMDAAPTPIQGGPYFASIPNSPMSAAIQASPSHPPRAPSPMFDQATPLLQGGPHKIADGGGFIGIADEITPAGYRDAMIEQAVPPALLSMNLGLSPAQEEERLPMFSSDDMDEQQMLTTYDRFGSPLFSLDEDALEAPAMFDQGYGPPG